MSRYVHLPCNGLCIVMTRHIFTAFHWLRYCTIKSFFFFFFFSSCAFFRKQIFYNRFFCMIFSFFLLFFGLFIGKCREGYECSHNDLSPISRLIVHLRNRKILNLSSYAVKVRRLHAVITCPSVMDAGSLSFVNLFIVNYYITDCSVLSIILKSTTLGCYAQCLYADQEHHEMSSFTREPHNDRFGL